MGSGHEAAERAGAGEFGLADLAKSCELDEVAGGGSGGEVFAALAGGIGWLTAGPCAAGEVVPTGERLTYEVRDPAGQVGEDRVVEIGGRAGGRVPARAGFGGRHRARRVGVAGEDVDRFRCRVPGLEPTRGGGEAAARQARAFVDDQRGGGGRGRGGGDGAGERMAGGAKRNGRRAGCGWRRPPWRTARRRCAQADYAGVAGQDDGAGGFVHGFGVQGVKGEAFGGFGGDGAVGEGGA